MPPSTRLLSTRALPTMVEPVPSVDYSASFDFHPHVKVRPPTLVVARSGFTKDRLPKSAGSAADNRGFTYMVMGANKFIYASAVRITAVKFIATMSASKDVLALASAEFDLSSVDVGKTITVKWRGKPVFIRHRTDSEISESAAVDLAALRDPQTDADRAEKPEWLVVMGICTHLGCVPIANAGDYGGWFCPCHGSHYDVSGRIRKGPAPLNLEIPPYSFIDDEKLLVG